MLNLIYGFDFGSGGIVKYDYSRLVDVDGYRFNHTSFSALPSILFIPLPLHTPPFPVER